MKQTATIKKYKSLMVKSNYIIEASYRLTLQQQRLIYLLIAKIEKEDTEFKPYRFTCSEISKIQKKHRFSYQELCDCISSLRNKELVIIKENSVLQTKWLSSAEYFDDGSIELCFDVKLKPYLLQLKERFTKLNLDLILNFSSNYTCRIYELLKQYESIGERLIALDDLKVMLCVEEYNLYSNFKQKVLLKARNEINKKSDIEIDFAENKKGRKVNELKFSIKTREIQENENAEYMKLVRAIIQENITSKDCIAILSASKNDIELIKEKYQVVSTMSNTKNVVGSLLSAIKEDWQPPKKKVRQGTFNAFKQRDYDFKDLEKKLLGWDNEEEG